jgi:hypothetical protein
MPERIALDRLAVGMYLVGIDKPWVQTPFLRHRFKITSDAQIAKLRQCGVKAVEIDPARGLPDPVSPGAAEAATAQGPNGAKEGAGPASEGDGPEHVIRVEPNGTRIYRADSTEGTGFTDLLRVRTLLQLAFPSQRQPTLATTRLLGWSERNFLMTELPFHEGHAIEFRPRSLCIVRFVEAGRVFGFKTETLRGQFFPIPLLFLSFPQEIEEFCLRRCPRAPVMLRTRVYLSVGLTTPLDGIIRDLSLSGCRLELTDPPLMPLKDTRVTLDIHLTGAGMLERVPGLIKNVTTKSTSADSQGAAKIQLGVQFEFQHSDPSAPAAVERFVNQQMDVMLESR